jgi:hypothetical protein
MGTQADPGTDIVKMDLSTDTDLAASADGVCRAIWVGTAGDLAITTLRGRDVVVPVGAGLFPEGAKVIKSTVNGTTAVDVFAIY